MSIESIGGRKAAAAVGIVAVGVVTVLLRDDIPSGFLSLLQTVFAAFVAGNAIEHAATAYRDVNGNGVPDEREAAPEGSLEPGAVIPVEVPPAQDEVAASLVRLEDGVAKVQEALAFIMQKVFGPKA